MSDEQSPIQHALVLRRVDQTNTRRFYALAAFRQGLREAGYVEGHNVTIEYRWAEGRYGELPRLVDDLVRRRVDVIAATGGTSSATAAKAATQSIPIVFLFAASPASTKWPDGRCTKMRETSRGSYLTKTSRSIRPHRR